MLAIKNRNVEKFSEEIFNNLFKVPVRPQLEFAEALWSPHRVMYVEDNDKVLMRATK